MCAKPTLDAFEALIEHSSIGGRGARLLKSRTTVEDMREVRARAEVSWQTAHRIRVLLAEDMDLLRSALVSLLSEEEDIEVVAALKCENMKVVPVAMRLRPDVAVVDVDLSGTRGLTAVNELRRRLPECQIVALAAAKPAGVVQRLLAADVLGVVDKNAPAARLLEAIRGAAKGEPVVDVSLSVAALAVEPNPLTPRELQVLELAAEGASGPEIAERLQLSPGTVRNYLAKVINKTAARTRVDAVRIAREAKWI